MIERLDGPAVISFSGGLTSAYMLRLLLDAGLAADVFVVFAEADCRACRDGECPTHLGTPSHLGAAGPPRRDEGARRNG